MRSTKILKNCSSCLWTCLHHMVTLRSQNKITDFFMIVAWASPFNCQRVATAIWRIYRKRHSSHLVGYIDDFAAAQPHHLADEGYHYLITLLRDELGIELSIN